MGNHYHLVVRTTSPTFPRGMRHLNGVYAQRFHRRHETCGHLFQGRFGSRLVVADSHLLEVARYVALNPVRAGYCANPEEWRWSAHRTLIGVSSSRLIKPQELWARFSADPAELAALRRVRHGCYG